VFGDLVKTCEQRLRTRRCLCGKQAIEDIGYIPQVCYVQFACTCVQLCDVAVPIRKDT
jgi:hypothetical protein